MNAKEKREKLEEIMNALPEELRSILAEKILSDAAQKPLNLIKEWINQFDSESPIDVLAAKLFYQFMNEYGDELELIKDNKVNGKDIVKCAIKALKKVTTSIECHLDNNECPNCTGHMH